MEKVDLKKRSSFGERASVIGIFVNLLLAAGKIAVGVLFGIASLTADGINNLTDCGSSAVSLLSFRLSSKPEDKEHPYGHERIEYICSVAVAVIILLVAFETAKDSISKIIAPPEMEFSLWVILVLAASILAKLGLFLFYRITAKKINSDILKAASVDSLSDCISTAVVLLTVVIAKLFGVNADGYATIFVAAFIAWSGIGILKETLSKLIGQAPDEELIRDIKRRITSREGVLGVHDVAVYCYGPNKFFVSAHVEVDASVDVLKSHEMVDDIEREFFTETDMILTGHLDPIVTDDAELNVMKERATAAVKELDARFSVHDFRMVKGERRTNVIFDVAIPFDDEISPHEIKNVLKEKLSAVNSKYAFVITVEHTL